jgi:WD40 repeat protein
MLFYIFAYPLEIYLYSDDGSDHVRATSQRCPDFLNHLLIFYFLSFSIVGGHADNLLKVIATESARVMETASGHCAPITCLGLSPDGRTLVTGSKDSTAILWHILGNSSSTNAGLLSDPTSVVEAAGVIAPSLATNDSVEASMSMIDFRRRHVEGPMFVLRGHVDELICCCVNNELDLVVSSSRSRGVLLHSISRGQFLRRLPVDRADVLALSPEGIILVFNKFSRVLQTFTVNGILVASKLLPSWEGSISSLIISRDGLHAVIGTSCGRALPPDRLQSKNVSGPDGVRHVSSQPQRGTEVTGDESSEQKRKGHPDNQGGHDGNESVSPSENAGRLKGPDSTERNKEQTITFDPQPAIILLELYTLEVSCLCLL